MQLYFYDIIGKAGQSMLESYTIFNTLKIITYIFAILSVVFLLIFIFIKKYLDIKKKKLETIEKKYAHGEIEKNPKNLDKKLILLGYSHAIGLKTLNTKDICKRDQLMKQIVQLQLYDRLYLEYTKAYTYESKLYLAFIMGLLGDPKGRDFYLELINNEKKELQYELSIWALLALAGSARKSSDIHLLQKTLDAFNKKAYVSQKLAQFFFVKAYLSVDQNNLINFLKTFQPEKFTLIPRAAIYALQEVPYTTELRAQLHYILKKNNGQTDLAIAILRVLHHWGCKEEVLIKQYVNSKNDLTRIVCAKIGMDMTKNPDNEYTLFLPYLYDSNPYVRKNIFIAFAKHNIKKESILNIIKKTNPALLQKKHFCHSFEQYNTGVL